jgi:hypothetical protein
MNNELREFSNVNLDGVDDYGWYEVNTSPWREVMSPGCAYHQLTAPDTKVNITSYLPDSFHTNRIPIYVYNRLNAKFCHPDGREAVFSYGSRNRIVFVDHVHDKGTYNYGDDGGNDFELLLSSIPFGDHRVYDMDTFNDYLDRLMTNDNIRNEIEGLRKENENQKVNYFPPLGNSKFWMFN